ncbi:hypothetical protein PoB_007209800 [Plakobranchus ocellatus]|uniref:Uncharacterized protein n=1 Tax=Plakobranchus ocellatus TaxID=259542 RepID=A0AAV4DNE7_9GAST|nr:hypothetical protein PoB_007209800 [Plakobranchus ocellatus]
MISGDPPAASTSATTWPCPEDRLEQLRRVRRKHLAQPAAPAPQLTFIREGDELVQQVMGGRPSWPGSGANSKQDRAGTQTVRGLQGVEVVGAAVAVGASADVGDGGVDDSGSSNFSSLQPNGGSSVRTSISSNSNSSYSKSKKHWKLIKGKPEDTANFRQGSERLMHEAVAHSKSPAYSTSSLPSTSVTNQLLADQSSSLSWRERVQQQQNALTSSGDAGADNQQITSGRWAVARRQEELSSIAHAQRIKHLIEQSRQQGGVDGTGLTLGRSVSEVDGRGKGRNSGGEGKETLRVEGQTHRNKTVHIPPATTISGLGNEKGASLEGSHGQRGNSFPSLHAVLPPVRKNRNDGDGGSPETQQKQRTQVNPVLGDLLDAQSFFSHCIPLDSIESTTGKHQQQQQQQHYHYHQHLQQRSVPGEKHQPAVAKPGSLSRSVGCVAATDTVSRITIATAAVVREPPQPRLKYSSTVHYKLTGGCLP